MTADQYAAKIAPQAIKACLNTGIFPSVVIAQAMLEGGNGSDYKAAQYNNPFGHMAYGNWSGPKVRRSKSGPFWRVYEDMKEAFSYHIDILKAARYKAKGVLLAKNPFEQLLAIQKGGYNAGPDKNEYAKKLSNIIRSRGLQKYDKELMAYERGVNNNNLAFVEQDGITRALHNLFS